MTVICFPGFPAPFSPFHITLFFSPLSPRLAGPKGLRYADQTRNERGEKVMWKETQREGKGTDYEPRFSVPSLRRVLRLIIGSLSTSLPSPSIPVPSFAARSPHSLPSVVRFTSLYVRGSPHFLLTIGAEG